MHFMTALLFSTLVLSMILVIIDGLSSNTYIGSDAVHILYNNNNNNSIDMVHIGDARVELLKAKRRESDGPTILAYIIIAAAIIVPNLPQID